MRDGAIKPNVIGRHVTFIAMEHNELPALRIRLGYEDNFKIFSCFSMKHVCCDPQSDRLVFIEMGIIPV